jgi:hypothetical protein
VAINGLYENTAKQTYWAFIRQDTTSGDECLIQQGQLPNVPIASTFLFLPFWHPFCPKLYSFRKSKTDKRSKQRPSNG